MERALAKRPRIEVPTIVLHPTDDGVTGPPSTNAAADKANFSQLIDRRIVQGAGHFMPREKPEAVATALVDVFERQSSGRRLKARLYILVKMNRCCHGRSS